MPLSRHLEQGHLLYFKQSPEAISVSENQHFRWLAFNGVLQSVMRKARPHWLTLPHQWALMLPWTYFLSDELSDGALNHGNSYSDSSCSNYLCQNDLRQSNISQNEFPQIVEFGLGGGNHLRFSQWLHPQASHLVIESSRAVIDISKTYFSLCETPDTSQIIHQSAEQWLASQEKITADWLIFDIYRQPRVGDNASHQLLEQLINVLPAQTILSINFTEATTQSLQFWLRKFQQKLAHRVALYRVPLYQNIVVHLFPKDRIPKDLMSKSVILEDAVSGDLEHRNLNLGEDIDRNTQTLSHHLPQVQNNHNSANQRLSISLNLQKRWRQFHLHHYFELDKKAD